jgi:hypothetical protein
VTAPICARCGDPFSGSPAFCFWCDARLCGKCIDIEGHCGHPEARAWRRRASEANEEGRLKMAEEVFDRAGRKPD